MLAFEYLHEQADFGASIYREKQEMGYSRSISTLMKHMFQSNQEIAQDVDATTSPPQRGDMWIAVIASKLATPGYMRDNYSATSGMLWWRHYTSDWFRPQAKSVASVGHANIGRERSREEKGHRSRARAMLSRHKILQELYRQ